MYREAEKIYEETLNKLKSIKGTREEKERRVNEHLPSISRANLRLAAISIAQRDYSKAKGYLDGIESPENLTADERVSRVELLSVVSEQRGQLTQAKKYLRDLIEAWEDKPELLAPTFLRLAELEMKSKSFSKAEEILLEIERLKMAGNEDSEDIWYKTLYLK